MLRKGGVKRGTVVSALGLTQILAWGSSYYLPAALAPSIAADRGWPLAWVVGGLSIGLFVAGLVSPRMGRAVQRRGGRSVLAFSSILMASGLVFLAAAQNLAMLYGAWIVIGAGMGIGLYDAAYATLGRLYGGEARRAITVLTLFGGFASTACWPLSTYLDGALGWRGACLVYAALHLGLALPIHAWLIPPPPPLAALTPPSGGAEPRADGDRWRRRVVVLLGVILTLAAAITTVMSVHILGVLRSRGIDANAAVAIGMLIGPAQVGARLVEMMLSRHHHPIWTLVASVTLMAVGLAALALAAPLVGAAIVIYAAGVGIESIARGIVPLALFGAGGYAPLMGRLAMPILLTQAVAPPLAAQVLTDSGSSPILLGLAGVAAVNVALGVALYGLCRPAMRGSTST
ncbi:MAG: MFS transporter [Alphaproteobacteria bacterium]|nr:MFS transporter [Alphaproteobacteria bacterium]